MYPTIHSGKDEEAFFLSKHVDEPPTEKRARRNPRSRMLDWAKRAPKPDQGARRQNRTTKKNPADEPKRVV